MVVGKVGGGGGVSTRVPVDRASQQALEGRRQQAFRKKDPTTTTHPTGEWSGGNTRQDD